MNARSQAPDCDPYHSICILITNWCDESIQLVYYKLIEMSAGLRSDNYFGSHFKGS